MYNQEIAHSEGWGVFAKDHGDVHIEKLDSSDAFESDYDAWAHVVNKARAGSAMHIDALNMVDPDEKLDIIAACGWYRKPWMQEAA